jgi:hypothetical protein
MAIRGRGPDFIMSLCNRADLSAVQVSGTAEAGARMTRSGAAAGRNATPAPAAGQV